MSNNEVPLAVGAYAVAKIPRAGGLPPQELPVMVTAVTEDGKVMLRYLGWGLGGGDSLEPLPSSVLRSHSTPATGAARQAADEPEAGPAEGPARALGWQLGGTLLLKDAALPAPGAVLAVTGNSHKDALKRASALAELINVEMTALGLPSVTHRTLVTLTSAKVGHSVKLFVKCAHHRPPPRPPADSRLTVAELKSARGVTQLSAEWWRIRQHRAVGSKCSTATAVARRLRELLDVDGLSSSPDADELRQFSASSPEAGKRVAEL